ncbi:hypothetical protein [Streptomyces sp. NPDC093060]|uniref:hypothetical protein n=1 Tax=Streptomyces sp. NPDC093060 TaxID=3366019 RepID=UPI00380B7445
MTAVAGAFAGGWFGAPPDLTYTPAVPASQPVIVTGTHFKDWEDRGWPTLGNRAGDRGPGHAAMEVTWRPLWRGTPAGGSEVAVFDQEVSYPSGQDYDANIRDGMIEVGIHKASVFNTVVSNYDDSITPDTAARIGCLKSATGIVVIGPATATTTRLGDLATGDHWTAHSNVLQVPKSQLPDESPDLAASANTPGKADETDTGTCAWP